MSFRCALPAIPLLLLAGCMHTSALMLGDQRFPAYSRKHNIVVYDAPEDVPFAYLKIARVVASGSSESRWDEVFEALKKKALEVGADALVLGRAGDDGTQIDGDGGAVMRRTLWALAIRRQPPKPTSPG